MKAPEHGHDGVNLSAALSDAHAAAHQTLTVDSLPDHLTDYALSTNGRAWLIPCQYFCTTWVYQNHI